jgi:cobalt-zinc-cadmium efflux system protein
MSEQHHHPKLGESSAGIAALRRGGRGGLVAVLVLTAVTMAGEFVGAWIGRSLSLRGDAFHMLTHLLSTALALAALVLAARPAPADKTWRWWRIEILAGLVNGLALLPAAAWVLWEAVDRFRHPVAIDARWTLAVGGIGLVVNLVCAALLHEHAKHDLNLKGAFLHMLADGASSVGVLLAAGAAWAFGWNWADPAVAALIGLLILAWCAGLVRESGRILLEAAPSDLKLAEVEAAMRGVDGVLEVHDLHVWTITSKMVALTAHVRLREDMPVSRAEERGRALRELLDARWHINHVVLQFEVEEGRKLHCEREAEEPTSVPPRTPP